MKKLIALVGLGFAFAVTAPVFAGDQQEKMKGCNKEAKDAGMKGDERKAFMKKCLSKDYKLKAEGGSAMPAAEPAMSMQQDRMKACTAEAGGKGLKDGERKTFMSACLNK
jgi:hypothetical protein